MYRGVTPMASRAAMKLWSRVSSKTKEKTPSSMSMKFSPCSSYYIMVANQVCDDFAVAAGPEGVGGELRPELFMVVDLPIHLQGKASFLFSTKEKSGWSPEAGSMMARRWWER